MTNRKLATAILIGATAASSIGVAAAPNGYLKAGAIDILQVLPPAPLPGDPRYRADRAIFRRTRKLVGTDRYLMATRDASEKTVALMADFSCAAGITLTPEAAPVTSALIERAANDTATQNNIAKDFYKRKRPFLQDRGEVCQAKPSTYDYPSGHTTLGWTWALILSDLIPERSTQILVRGRAYGESRFICGVHNESAVEAGRLSATVTMQAVRQTEAYRQDSTKARVELMALASRSGSPSANDCSRESRLTSQRVF